MGSEDSGRSAGRPQGPHKEDIEEKDASASREARSGAPGPRYEITTSYRDTFGGNAGTNMDGWRSASSSPVKEPRLKEGACRSILDGEPDGPGETNVKTGSAQISPMQAPAASLRSRRSPLDDIAILTTGQVLRHKDAMQSLVEALKVGNVQHGAFDDSIIVEREVAMTTSSLIATNGGTHLMAVNLIESSDRGMRDLCAEGLVEMFRQEPSAIDEVVSSRETVSKLLGVSVREMMLVGKSSVNSTSAVRATYRELFKVLVKSPSQHVPKSCAEHKVVHKLVERLRSSRMTTSMLTSGEEDVMTILSTLQMMLDTGKEYYASSLVWNGALDILLPLLASNGSEDSALSNDTDVEWRSAMLRLVASVCLGRRDGRSVVEAWICTVESVKGLSSVLADDSYSMEVQIFAARVLLEISDVRAKKRDVLDAMIDHCLPRACEIILDGDESDEESAEIVSLVAAIGSNLARDSTLALEVLVFHANVLRRVVDVLVRDKAYEMGRGLLRVARDFAVTRGIS